MNTPLDPKPGHVFGLSSPLLNACATIKHGFLTRRGWDESGAPFDCSWRALGQNPETRALNRRIGARFFEVDPSFFRHPHQVHGNHVHVFDHPDACDTGPLTQPTADALVTTIPGIAIGVITADCVPILLCDPMHQVIAAIHAGWRGAWDHIVGKTLAVMTGLGAAPSLIRAAIGPAIQQSSYLVGGDVYDAFTGRYDKGHLFFHRTSSDHFLFDLPGFVRQELENSGIKCHHIHQLPHNTYDNENAFHSYRRSTHRGDKTFGCQFSGLMITASRR